MQFPPHRINIILPNVATNNKATTLSSSSVTTPPRHRPIKPTTHRLIHHDYHRAHHRRQQGKQSQACDNHRSLIVHLQGLGRGFVEKYLSRPNTTVVAAARNPAGEDAKDLVNIPKAEGTKLITVKIDSTSETDAANAIASIKDRGVARIDVVIANAGIFKSEAFLEVSKAKTSDLIEHVDVNVNGPIRLFQAVLPLLQAAKQPKFVVISSGVATISGAEHIPWAVSSYGASKAALNFILRRIHIENQDLIAIAFHPG